MWIKRDFEIFLRSLTSLQVHPIKVIKGPRQVGKTSLLEQNSKYKIIEFDDFQTRSRALENPRLFLDQYSGPIVLDEATLVPSLFLELKRRVDDSRRRAKDVAVDIDIWVTGSNQTLLENSVQESLAGRANYFDLNTLSLHEIGHLNLPEIMLRGGWPGLYVNSQISPQRYLNDLISTFIERDIVAAAGIERKEAFVKMTGLLAGRLGQLINASDLAKNTGVEVTTIQSWIAKLKQNAILRIIPPYFSNLNKRLIKTPKIYFEDVGLASRLQGWTEYQPLYVSPSFGHLVENLALIEISRTFTNHGIEPEIYFARTKEQIEIDFLVKLSNNRWIAVEVKSTPTDFSEKQKLLIEQFELNVIERWIVAPIDETYQLKNARVIPMLQIYNELIRLGM